MVAAWTRTYLLSVGIFSLGVKLSMLERVHSEIREAVLETIFKKAEIGSFHCVGSEAALTQLLAYLKIVLWNGTSGCISFGVSFISEWSEKLEVGSVSAVLLFLFFFLQGKRCRWFAWCPVLCQEHKWVGLSMAQIGDIVVAVIWILVEGWSKRVSIFSAI